MIDRIAILLLLICVAMIIFAQVAMLAKFYEMARRLQRLEAWARAVNGGPDPDSPEEAPEESGRENVIVLGRAA